MPPSSSAAGTSQASAVMAVPLPARRAALAVTRIDEVDMTMAAISGVTMPAMASGTQTTL